MNDLVKGTLAGFIATAPMSAAMGLMFRFLPPGQQYPLPPRQVAMRIFGHRVVRENLEEPNRQNLTLLSHFAYGAAAGGAYAPLARALKHSPIGSGVAFGLTVWAGSYLGWLPALGVISPATRHPAERNALMIAAHIVWGAAAGAVLNRLMNEDDAHEQSQPMTSSDIAEPHTSSSQRGEVTAGPQV